MSTNLAMLRRPPGRALFNVKSRTLRALTMVSCWWRLNVVTMAIPLSFFFHFFSKMWGHTPIPRQDMNWEKNLLWGTHIPPPYLEFAKLQVYRVKSPSVVVLHQGISRYCSWCSSHVRRCCLSIILLDLPLERLATKNTQGKLYPRTCSCFYWKGNK